MNLDKEHDLRRAGFQSIAGVDEVGRGPLAGPVIAAAVILDLAAVPEGLADSKGLSAAKRESLFERILGSAHIGIASIPNAEIDAINIRQASLLAMGQALQALPISPDYALIDGNDAPPCQCPLQTIVKGDARIASIAAASIVAKVTRDRLMARLAESYPAYGFEKNAGYGTAFHREALKRVGPSPYHRLSFAPLKNGRSF